MKVASENEAEPWTSVVKESCVQTTSQVTQASSSNSRLALPVLAVLSYFDIVHRPYA